MQFRNTSLFSLRWRANPVNSYAIAYTVMVRLYFAFDTKELLRGDLQSRFAAYKTALDANFMQIDEVRYAEDMEPLGLDWIRLGLQDVLYDPKTREVFTPNTGTRQQLNGPAGEPAAESGLQEEGETGILEEQGRDYKRDEKGRFAGGGGGGGKHSGTRGTSKRPGGSLRSLIGMRTGDGKIVKTVHPHAEGKLQVRDVYVASAAAALKTKPHKGNKPGYFVYEKDGTQVVFADKDKMICTVIYKGKKR